jgi:hypothetical protein
MFIAKKLVNSSFTIILPVLGLMLTFLSAPFILNEVSGIKPGDPGYRHYFQSDGTPNTPYQDFIVNGCLTAPVTGGDEKVVFDTNGLVELGMLWFDPNTCFDIAMSMTGEYNVTSVVKDMNDQMIVTLTRK